MVTHQLLLDAFAEARRSWDDLIALQPDIVAASRDLETTDLRELELRVEAHRMAIDVLADTLESEAVDTTSVKE
jgi:hypothetical protein